MFLDVVKNCVLDELQERIRIITVTIHNDAIRESEELDKPLLFSKENFKKNLYVAVQKESKEDIIKRKTEFEGIEK